MLTAEVELVPAKLKIIKNYTNCLKFTLFVFTLLSFLFAASSFGPRSFASVTFPKLSQDQHLL